jgi:GTP:adenosylcobinamide-phosphate guanylyltransferase
MTAVSFAEADEHDTARQIMAGGSHKRNGSYEKKLAAVLEQCHREGIQVNVHTTDLDAVTGIRTFLKEHAGVDKVVLSPVVTEAGNVTTKDLNRLVRTASRPIVTMTRQACAVA